MRSFAVAKLSRGKGSDPALCSSFTKRSSSSLPSVGPRIYNLILIKLYNVNYRMICFFDGERRDSIVSLARLRRARPFLAAANSFSPFSPFISFYFALMFPCCRNSTTLVTAVKGTKDVYGEEALKWRYLRDSFRKLARVYGYKEVLPFPLFLSPFLRYCLCPLCLGGDVLGDFVMV